MVSFRLPACLLALLFLFVPIAPPSTAQSVLVLAGGGAEGDVGDTAAWSYEAYGALLDAGDVTGDGTIRVAILSTDAGRTPNWLPDYFEWIGSTRGERVEAQNVIAPTRAAASDPAVIAPLDAADVVFIKGGDQGAYVDAWDETPLEAKTQAVADRNGALGGTSAGAMLLADITFGPEKDLISTDVLADAHTPYLNDADGGSGLHPDVFATLSGLVIDTHFTWRGRLGRLAGILAKGLEDDVPVKRAVGIDEYTALIVSGKVARVHGHGAATFLQPTPLTTLTRTPGDPLSATHLRLDRLADGWGIFPETGIVLPPDSAEPVSDFEEGPPASGALQISGRDQTAVRHFETILRVDPFRSTATSADVFLPRSVGFTNAMDRDLRGFRHEAVFRGLYEDLRRVGFLVYTAPATSATGRLVCTDGDPNAVQFDGALASIVLDASPATHRGLAEDFASKNGVPRTAALQDVTMHVLADTDLREIAFDVQRRTLRRPVDPGTPVEPDAPLPSTLQMRVQGSGSASRIVVHLRLPKDLSADLALYDVMGRRVRTVLNDRLNAGRTSVSIRLDGLATGPYFVHLITPNATRTEPVYRVR